jgi:hypothetical protein
VHKEDNGTIVLTPVVVRHADVLNSN